MPRAMVTGATGFVGSNLVGQLRKRDWDVVCLVRNPQRAAKLEALGATLQLGELGDPESVQRATSAVDTIFHVAGRVRALRDREFHADNVEGTQNVVQAAATQKVPPAIVMVSSLAAGGPSQPGTPRRETDPDQPISAYGKSKLDAERAAAQFGASVPLSIIRPPIIFGPADSASLAIFRGVKLTRLHAVPGLRTFPVSLVHVADLCDAIIRLAERGERVSTPSNGAAPKQGIYYVAAERTIPYGDFGKLAAQSLGQVGIAVPLPRGLFWIVGGAMEAVGQVRRKPAVLNLDKVREALAPGWECSDEKIRAELGYQPSAPLETRFAETAQWYRDAGWL